MFWIMGSPNQIAMDCPIIESEIYMGKAMWARHGHCMFLKLNPRKHN